MYVKGGSSLKNCNFLLTIADNDLEQTKVESTIPEPRPICPNRLAKKDTVIPAIADINTTISRFNYFWILLIFVDNKYLQNQSQIRKPYNDCLMTNKCSNLKFFQMNIFLFTLRKSAARFFMK